jgi:hypothetical protein
MKLRLNDELELKIVVGRVGVGKRSSSSLLHAVGEIEEGAPKGCDHQWVLSFGSDFMVYVCEKCYEVKHVKQEPLKIYSISSIVETKSGEEPWQE